MEENKPIIIEMFYSFTCPNCNLMKRRLEEVLPQYGNKFELKRSHASSPMGLIKTMKYGIHAVPALMIDKEVVFRSVPTKEELTQKLNSY